MRIVAGGGGAPKATPSRTGGSTRRCTCLNGSHADALHSGVVGFSQEGVGGGEKEIW